MTRTFEVGRVHTTIATRDGMITVTYHQTDVVKFNENKIILNSNGYHTNTTKTRMNQASHQFALLFAVYQKDFSWFVTFKGREIPFMDGMILKR